MLQHSPGNPTALTYQALVRFTMGQPEAAILTLQRAQAAAPDLLDSYAVLSLIYAKTGHLELARQTITQAAQRFPSRRPVLGQMFAELRSQVVAEQIAAAGAPSPDRMVSAHSSGLDPPPDLDQGALRAAGVLRLASATRPAAGPAVVFLIVRAAESSEGEPVALRRIATSSFPVQFSIHDADSLVGEPLPSRFHIEARLDSDGDPETRSPGDLSVDSGPIAAGTRTLELILR